MSIHDDQRAILEALGLTVSNDEVAAAEATLKLRPGLPLTIEVRYLLKPFRPREDAQGVCAVLRTFRLVKIAEEEER